MEMTRRNFFQKLIKASFVVAVGALKLAGKAAPRKFLWAIRIKKYPSLLKPLRNICEKNKWSG
ncbi:MAG: hypothetical protein ACYTFW_14120 [Planctomycetota bacterium]|jgi:hypothetical protein